MKIDCTGVILAGGVNKRLPGIHKGFREIGGKRVVDFVFDVYQEIFNEIIVVTNQPEEYRAYDAKIVTDIIQIRSSLAGIHSGLFHATHPLIFVSACDTPFLKKDLVLKIIESFESGIDIVIPQTFKGLEPLCAVYHKKCFEPIETVLKEEKLIIKEFILKSRTKFLGEEEIVALDPELQSFFNINTPEDWKRSEEILKQKNSNSTQLISKIQNCGLI